MSLENNVNYNLLNESYNKEWLTLITYMESMEEGLTDKIAGYVIELLPTGVILLFFLYSNPSNLEESELIPVKKSLYFEDILSVEAPYFDQGDATGIKKVAQHMDMAKQAVDSFPKDLIQSTNNVRSIYGYNPTPVELEVLNNDAFDENKMQEEKENRYSEQLLENTQIIQPKPSIMKRITKIFRGIY